MILFISTIIVLLFSNFVKKLFNLFLNFVTVDERENSHLGRLVTKLRNRLNAETTSNLSYEI
jgi:hypothetical protein